MVEGKFLRGTNDLTDCYKIRQVVFCEEQGKTSDEEFDGLDKDCIHVLIFEGDEYVATGRLYCKDEYYKIGRIAVLKHARGKHYGDFVVRMLIDQAFQLGAKKVYVGAQIKAISFYKKIGFKVNGEEYEEARMPHIPMEIEKIHLCTGCKK